MAVFLSLLLVSFVMALMYLKYVQKYWQRRGIPHIEPHFPSGNMKDWKQTKHLIDIFAVIYDKFKGSGPFAGVYIFFNPVVLALDLEVIKNILIRDFNNFDERGIFHNEKDDPLSDNMMQTDGKRWRPLRHKLSPTFTSAKMKSMFRTVLKVGEEFSEVFGEKFDATDKGVLEVTDLLARFTVDVIGSCAFGLECNSLRNPNSEFLIIGKRNFVSRRHCRLIDSVLVEGLPVLEQKMRLRQYDPVCTDFYMRIVRETVEYREKNNINRDDFMNMLIEMKSKSKGDGGLTLEQIAAQAFLFFLAGFETSAATLGFALYELAHHQHIQDKLREEINEVLERHNNEFTYDSMRELRYMEQVLMETLRKYPTIPVLRRKAQQHYETTHPKYYIEKGTNVIIPIYSIHHDPDLYPEPEKFLPSRFSEDEIKKRPACAALPFGDGPRNCIGLRFGKMQFCIGLTYLLKNFKFHVSERTETPIKFSTKTALLSALNGIYLKVEKVDHAT